MTYGRSIYKALDNFGIPRATRHELAADRSAWRAAIHGSLLKTERPTRAAATSTNLLIRATLADARASIMDIGAYLLRTRLLVPTSRRGHSLKY